MQKPVYIAKCIRTYQNSNQENPSGTDIEIAAWNVIKKPKNIEKKYGEEKTKIQ